MTKQSIEQILLNAVAHVRAGETEQAQALCEEALALLAHQMPLPSAPQPQSVGEPPAEIARPEVAQMAVPSPPKEKQEALLNLYNQGELASVVEQAAALAQQFPQAAVLWNLLGAANAGLGHVQQAEHAFREACRVQPNDADGYNNLGNVLQKQNKLDEAIAAYQRSIEIKPNNARVHNNLGSALRSQNRLDEAISAYQIAIQINPNYVDTHINLSILLKMQNKFDHAIAVLQNALKIYPKNINILYKLGSLFMELYKFDEAMDIFNQIIKINLAHAGALNQIGRVLQEQNKLKESIEFFQRAIDSNSEYQEAYVNIGNSMSRQQKLDEAIAYYHKAIAIKPTPSGIFNNIGGALVLQNKLIDAISVFDQAEQIDSKNKDAKFHAFHLRQHICDWKKLDDMKLFINNAENKFYPFSLFALLSMEDCNKRQMMRAKSHFSAKLKNDAIPFIKFAREKSPRLRVGYFSSDFHDHPTLHLMAGLLRHHNKSSVEIFFYSYSRMPLGPIGDLAKNHIDHFFDITDLSRDNIVNLVRFHELDIAIDLNGYTRNSRTYLFQLRMAPVQINYLGYPGTMGTDFIDYIIADSIVIPESQRSFYTENLIYMPNSYQPNDDMRDISKMLTARADFGLPEDAFVFCCFNNNYKISPREFDIWMRLLANINDSVIWLLRANQWAEANLRREAQARGIDPNRLVFAEKIPNADHLARHKHADLFIDTFNYNAHTTASDALWAGLPVVTMLGQQFAARVAGSLLNAIGLPELITHSEQEYEALILELARDRQKLQALKCKLASNRLTQPLFDTKRYTRNFENGLRMIVDRYRQGMAPQDIFIQKEMD